MSRRDADKATRREKWMVQRIADTFGLGESRVLSAMRQEENVELLLQFIGREGPRRLFVYYQPRVSPADAAASRGADAVVETEINDFENEPVLFLTLGNAEPLLSKACYFVRMGTTMAVDMDTSADATVLFGEIGMSAAGVTNNEEKDGGAAENSRTEGLMLSDVHTLIEVLFSKGLSNLAQDAWGPAATGQRSEILDDISRFEVELHQTLKSRSRILDLPSPSEEYVDSPKIRAAKLAKEQSASGSYGRMAESSYNKTNSYESKRIAHYEVRGSTVQVDQVYIYSPDSLTHTPYNFGTRPPSTHAQPHFLGLHKIKSFLRKPCKHGARPWKQRLMTSASQKRFTETTPRRAHTLSSSTGDDASSGSQTLRSS